MCIGETHPLICDAIDIRSSKRGLRIVAGSIAPTKVIGENEKDVRMVGGRSEMAQEEKNRQEG